MNSNPDPELHRRFQAQRQAEGPLAPAFEPRLLRTAAPAEPVAWMKLLWLPAGAAALLAMGFFWVVPNPDAQPTLSEALPVLLDTPAQPLFASLESPEVGAPSDFLLPAHLTIQMP